MDLKQNTREEVAAVSPNLLQRVMQNLTETLEGMCLHGTPPHRHYIQEVNIVIKML